LKKVYSLYYFHLDSTWHELCIIKNKVSKELITSLITQSGSGVFALSKTYKLLHSTRHNILLVSYFSIFSEFHARFEGNNNNNNNKAIGNGEARGKAGSI
jgi:hypothetical protein